MTSKAQLLISDENRLFREGLTRILTNRKMEVVGEVSTLSEAVAGIRAGDFEPNLLLCDPSVDNTHDFAVIKEITRDFPELKVVVLTNRVTSSWLFMALEAGAHGLLPKDISADALQFSIELALLGEMIFPTQHALLEAKHYTMVTPPPSQEPSALDHAPLSPRERQILHCLVSGQPNKTIARNLDMAEATVKVHLKALLRKINVRNRTQAAIWGMNHVGQKAVPKSLTEVPDTNDMTGIRGNDRFDSARHV